MCRGRRSIMKISIAITAALAILATLIVYQDRPAPERGPSREDAWMIPPAPPTPAGTRSAAKQLAAKTWPAVDESYEHGDPSTGPDAVDEYKRKVDEGWAARLAAHDAAEVDTAFAAFAEPLLSENLKAMAGAAGGYELLGVDCRGDSCRARMLWDDYTLAIKSHRRLLVSPYDVDCSTDILLPDPDDAAAAYQGTFLLHCERGRSNL